MKNLKLNESKFLNDFFPNHEETKHYEELLINSFNSKKLPCFLTKKDLPKLKENIKCNKTCFIDDIVFFRSKIKKEEITEKIKCKLDSVEKNYFFFTIGDFSFVLMLDVDLINIENYKESLKKKFQEFQFNHLNFTENDLLRLYNFVNDYNYCFILHKDYEILFIENNFTTKSNLDFLKIKDLIIAYESKINSLTFDLNNRNPENIEQVYNEKNIISDILVVSENLNATSVLIKTENKKFYCIKEKNKISYPKIETREYMLFVHNPNLKIERFCSWFNFEFHRFIYEIFENLPEKIVDIEVTKVIQEINTNERKYKYIETYYEKPKISISIFDEYYTRIVEIFSETDILTNYSYNFYFNNNENLAKLIFPVKILQKGKNNLSNSIKIEVVKNINDEILRKNIKYFNKNNNVHLGEWLTKNLPENQFEKFVLKYVF